MKKLINKIHSKVKTPDTLGSSTTAPKKAADLPFSRIGSISRETGTMPDGMQSGAMTSPCIPPM